MKSLNPSFDYATSRAEMPEELLPLEIESMPRSKDREISGSFMDRDLTVRAVAVAVNEIRSLDSER